MNKDPLLVVNPKLVCTVCGGKKPARKSCDACQRTGYKTVDLNGLWAPSAGFLVCGGPSTNKLPFQRLRERGIVSLAINNSSGHIPVTAWCFGDPAEKFHHGVHLDPKCLTFAPIGKLGHPINAKMPDGKFRKTGILVRDCPGTLGFSRDSYFKAETFFSTTFAHWGVGAKNTPEEQAKYKCLCSMLLGLRLMYYLGCPRVYMLGVDFNMTEKEQYSFAQQKNPRNGRYANENAMLKDLRPVFEQHGFKVYNCNPESKCDVFEYVPFEKAFADCKGGVPDEPFDLAKWYDKADAENDIAANPTPVTLEELNKIQQAPKGSELCQHEYEADGGPCLKCGQQGGLLTPKT